MSSSFPSKSIENTKNKIEEANKQRKRLIDYKHILQDHLENNLFLKETFTYKNKTYFISTEFIFLDKNYPVKSVNVSEFDERCFLLDGKLVEIESPEELTDVAFIFISRAKLTSTKIYIGLQLVDGIWKYRSNISGPNAFRSFRYQAEFNPSRPCAYFQNYVMYDAPCLEPTVATAVRYMCERPTTVGDWLSEV